MDIKKAQNDFKTFQAVQILKRYKAPRKATKSLKRSGTITQNVYLFGLNPFVLFVRRFCSDVWAYLSPVNLMTIFSVLYHLCHILTFFNISF